MKYTLLTLSDSLSKPVVDVDNSLWELGRTGASWSEIWRETLKARPIRTGTPVLSLNVEVIVLKLHTEDIFMNRTLLGLSEFCFRSFFVPEENRDGPWSCFDGFRMRSPQQACDAVSQSGYTWKVTEPWFDWSPFLIWSHTGSDLQIHIKTFCSGFMKTFGRLATS